MKAQLKQSIYDYIVTSIDPATGKIPAEKGELPDSKDYYRDNKLRWVNGGMDGGFSFHCGGGDTENNKIKELYAIIREHCNNPSAFSHQNLYGKLKETEAIDIIDPLLNYIREKRDINTEALFNEALWLIKNGRDRNAVKFGIAIMGMFRCEKYKDILMALGKHEEFTVYSVVALKNGVEAPNDCIFELAKCLDGWGKIQCVTRLEPETDKIKEWLLKKGCKNNVMNAYLAYTCAENGELKKRLMPDSIDKELYSGAVEIMEGLIDGGPSRDIDDLDEPMLLISRFLCHSQKHCRNLEQLRIIAQIKDFINKETDHWEDRYKKDWTQEGREACSIICDQIINQDSWKTTVLDTVESSNNSDIFNACDIAKVLNIDIWERLFAKLRKDPYKESFYYYLSSDIEERAVRLADFAAKHLPLKKIATGPKDEMGFGQEFKYHSCLDFILQMLEKHPGIGHELIEAALWSPVVRNRYKAISILEKLDKKEYTHIEIKRLQVLSKSDPNTNVRERAKKLMSN